MLAEEIPRGLAFETRGAFHAEEHDIRRKQPNHAEESARTARVWVKKGSLGLRYEPFRVEDTAYRLPE